LTLLFLHIPVRGYYGVTSGINRYNTFFIGHIPVFSLFNDRLRLVDFPYTPFHNIIGIQFKIAPNPHYTKFCRVDFINIAYQSIIIHTGLFPALPLFC